MLTTVAPLGSNIDGSGRKQNVLLKNKIAVVTGGSIGLATAKRSVDQGQDASGNASIRNCMKALTLLLTNFCEVWRTQTSTR
jgi:hypothetical protein